MSDREEFEKAMRKVYVGYCYDYLEHVAGYTEDCIDDAWTGWQAAIAAAASMQAKLDALDAEKQLYVADGLKATKEADALEARVDALEAKLNIALGALADFAYSEDVTLEVVKAKSKRLHSELTEGL